MRVVVIGGGVIGMASAYELVKQGHEVTVLEAGTVGGGASRGTAGWICPADSGPVAAPGMVLQGLRWMLHADSPLRIRPRASLPYLGFLLGMAQRCNADDFRAGLRANIALFGDSMETFDAWQQEGVAFEMQADGLLIALLGRDNYEHQLHDLDIVRDAGLDPVALEGDAVREHEPALSDRVHGGIFFPHERHIRSETLAPGLAAAARARGVEVRERTALEGVVRDGRRVTALRTSDGRIPADAVVLAAGVWTERLARLFGVRLPIEPGKGYSVEYAQAPVRLRSATSFTERKVVGTPLGNALRLAGTMEFAGYDPTVDPVRAAAILRGPAEFLRDWTAPEPDAPAWAGFRPMTPDSLSIIGRLGAHDNAYVASGHGMFGITMAPATARAVVTMVETGRVPAHLAPFAPDRFGARDTVARLRRLRAR